MIRRYRPMTIDWRSQDIDHPQIVIVPKSGFGTPTARGRFSSPNETSAACFSIWQKSRGLGPASRLVFKYSFEGDLAQSNLFRQMGKWQQNGSNGPDVSARCLPQDFVAASLPPFCPKNRSRLRGPNGPSAIASGGNGTSRGQLFHSDRIPLLMENTAETAGNISLFRSPLQHGPFIR